MRRGGAASTLFHALRRPLPPTATGKAAQVDPIKATLKPTGAERLKLECDVLLSASAFNFNLRRFTPACCPRACTAPTATWTLRTTASSRGCRARRWKWLGRTRGQGLTLVHFFSST